MATLNQGAQGVKLSAVCDEEVDGAATWVLT